MALKDMAYTPEEAKSAYGCAPTDGDDANLPKYPWGLELRLEDESLGKLGMTQLPQVGTEMYLIAKVKVTGISSREREGSTPCASAELQITAMELGADPDGGSAANKLYGDS